MDDFALYHDLSDSQFYHSHIYIYTLGCCCCFCCVCVCVWEQGSVLHEHARPLNKRCAWRLTTGFAFIKMACLKAIIAIILLVGLGECACDLTKCVVCKKTLTWS